MLAHCSPRNILLVIELYAKNGIRMTKEYYYNATHFGFVELSVSYKVLLNISLVYWHLLQNKEIILF